MITIDIAVETSDWPDEAALLCLAEKALQATVGRLQLEDCCSELSIVFTGDAQMRALNKQWRDKDKATNVLSFPAYPVAVGDKPGPMLGDIILAYDSIAREALQEHKSFDQHLSHLIVHGVLHLLGYDHEQQADALVMEQLEREILQGLAICDPYAVVVDRGSD